MDYSKYKTIQVMKSSDKAEVLFAAVDGMDQPVVVKRLFEANPEIYSVIERLQDVHIPQIYSVCERDGELLVVEEYLDGRTLDVYLAEEALSDVQKLELMVQLCEALEVLHGCTPPVIHRDIKPSNILITEDGIIKVIDFDASRQYKGEKNTSDTRLLGTIEYAAPEQFGYAQTDFRSDIYSVGVVFSEIEVGENAFIAKDWKRLVDKCTSFDPENRYKNVPELKKDLLKCIRKAKQPAIKRWIVPVATGAVIFVMLIAGGVQLQREKDNILPTVTPTAPVTQEAKEPEPTKEPAYNKADGIVLVEDRLNWTEETLPVTVKVREGALDGVKAVYLCELADPEDPYSEMITLIASELYEVSEDGRTLRLGTAFFNEYGERTEIVLFVEFEDGRGERVWLTHTATAEEA